MDRLAVCLDGVADDELLAIAVPWTTWFASIDILCAYGDVAARELQHLRERHGRPPPPPPHGNGDIDRAQAEAIAERGAAVMRDAHVDAVPRVLGGRDAGHALAEASAPNIALLLGAGHRGGTGPKSIGHVTRFVVDHAKGPVIVVRLTAP